MKALCNTLTETNKTPESISNIFFCKIMCNDIKIKVIPKFILKMKSQKNELPEILYIKKY